ncbi:hypothetical protein [Micromonospora vulcania]|uniref:Uncharacterized protein n=1 Tax=Micromonospora vulcania TaxID=1441873 RepID=A0ABW1HAI9_9ACTN
MTNSTVPAASALWAVEQVTAELRETYLAVAAARVLLERTSVGCAHPAVRQARRSGEDALDLAGDAERQLSDGVQMLRAEAGHETSATIADLVETLDTVREQLTATATRIGQYPAQVTAAAQQLRDTADNGPVAETASSQWFRAAEQLDLMAQSLTSAASALGSYTAGLSGAEAPTT